MKKRIPLLALLLLCALLMSYAAAAGGGAGDPLISLDYLKSVFVPQAERAVDQKLDDTGGHVYDAAVEQWNNALAGAGKSAATHAPIWTEARFKQGDALTGLTGTQVVVLAGGAEVQFSSGAVIDVTTGTELASGSALMLRHRYMVAEDTTAVFTTSSRTSVIDCCGDYRTMRSKATDYNAMAAALKSLTLLRGTDTGFGQGFDLEKAPTRIEALVMLIRLLGEEQAALECTAPQPFPDVPAWAAPYVAYAYEKGYTNGIGGGLFGTMRQVVAVEYEEFVLRALGYSSTERSNISDALDRALADGVITPGESALLRSAEFLRADVVYLSYYALETPLAGDHAVLHEKLEGQGVFRSSAYSEAKKTVASPRIS